MNWTREKEPPSGVGDGADGQRLGEAGDALDQQVAARQQRDEHALEQGVLAGDDAADLEQRRLERGRGVGPGALAGVEGGERDGCHAAE